MRGAEDKVTGVTPRLEISAQLCSKITFEARQIDIQPIRFSTSLEQVVNPHLCGQLPCSICLQFAGSCDIGSVRVGLFLTLRTGTNFKCFSTAQESLH